jgi:hypothetical protein
MKQRDFGIVFAMEYHVPNSLANVFHHAAFGSKDLTGRFLFGVYCRYFTFEFGDGPSEEQLAFRNTQNR